MTITMIDGTLSSDHLKQFIERIERLEEEKSNISEDIRAVYTEAKGTGFDVKIIRKVIALRKMEQNEIDEEEMLIDTYKRALGMLVDTEE